MKRDLFESILSLSLQQKIDLKNWHAEDLFDLSSLSFLCSHWWISVKDQKAGVIDESPADMDILLTDDIYFLWLLKNTGKVSFANKFNFKECMCAISWKTLINSFIELFIYSLFKRWQISDT